MNPELMKVAMEQMKVISDCSGLQGSGGDPSDCLLSHLQKMSPEQIQQMQRMAANMPPEMVEQASHQVGSMRAEDLERAKRELEGMSSEDFTKKAAEAQSYVQAQAQHKLSGAQQLKSEGNELIRQGRYEEALVKYRRAALNAKDAGGPQAGDLMRACALNTAQCYLKLQRWTDCLEACEEVLVVDNTNMKALYRKGCAMHGLGKHAEAMRCLRRAAEQSQDDAENLAMIHNKIKEVELSAGSRQAAEGHVEDQEDPAPPKPSQRSPATAAAAAAAAAETIAGLGAEPPRPRHQQQSGSVPTINPDDMRSMVWCPAAVLIASGLAALPLNLLHPSLLPRQMDAIKADPDAIKRSAEVMRQMSPAQIRAMAAAQGRPLPPGMDSDEAVQRMIDQMSSLSPEQLEAAARLASSSSAASSAAPGSSAGAAPSRDQIRATADMLKRDPAALRQMAGMMENLTPEQLEGIRQQARAMGQDVSPEQMKMAASMMKVSHLPGWQCYESLPDECCRAAEHDPCGPGGDG